MPTENNTANLFTPKTYLAGLVANDYYKDEQELIKAEDHLSVHKNNSYWSNRVEFLKEKINSKKELEKSLRTNETLIL
jgi:hypothetical protein